ncbi:MAG: ribonuclease E/G [Rhodobacteraceae bacterium]|nr:ribonuclease E/G [Paracoccaceae bacterium]
MAKKMLIDATHAEETRVVVVEGNKVEEFDFESLNKQQLAGNIYLAKVTRVEPSLQAAFVDYGGNRHGFLAFSEIHPDYYQIPIEDRKLLIEEERAYAQQIQEESEKRELELENELTTGEQSQDINEFTDQDEEKALDTETTNSSEALQTSKGETNTETADKEDLSEVNKIKPRHRRYKIQEVVKVRQILLIQVVKEERGNKGAALTTYLSIAGRYCVLMPNTARGGGISRKITNANDRKRLKSIANDLDIPDGTGLIIRTAGANRTKVEIKRDFEYLLRQWEEVRDLTLKSIAPCQIYEEGSLIKRSIRDLYTRDVDEIFVEGEQGHKSAKEFMKMLMPSHAKKIRLYDNPMPLFARYQVESFLSGMFNPTVQLKSGGYIVIGITEALVAIDVNSGRATKEASIEETALKTNLEASEEVARQLRLRDLAGLIVIDFIDMDERRNNNSVEKRLKEKLKNDRARIQVGRISNFGLLEMSRQRLRPGMLEATTAPCDYCHGTGLIRSDDNLALTILREIEEEAVRGKNKELLISSSFDVANFLINQKRDHILEIEKRNSISIRIEAQPNIKSPNYTIEKFKDATRVIPKNDKQSVLEDTHTLAITETQTESSGKVVTSEEESTEKENFKKKRRRRKRNGKSKTNNNETNNELTVSAVVDTKIVDDPKTMDIIENNEAKKENKKTENRKTPTKAATKDQNKLELDDQSKSKIEIEPVKKRRGRPKKDNTEKSKLDSNLAVASDQNEDVHSKKIAIKKQNPKAKAPPEEKKPKETKNKTPRSGWWSRNK